MLGVKELKGLLVTALVDEGQTALDAGMHRAGHLAGGRAAFFDGIGAGHGLGIELVGRLALAQAQVEAIVGAHRADLVALAAGSAFVHIDKTRLFSNGDGEIASLAVNPAHLRLGEQFDVQMASGLHQLGRDDAHGAVVGGEGLVQLGHHAADGRLALHQVDLITAIGQVQRGLDAGDTAADHHHRTDCVG